MTPFQEDLYRLIQEVRKDTNPFTTSEQDAGSDLQRIVEFSNQWDYKTQLEELKQKYEKLEKTSKMEKQLAVYKEIRGIVKELVPIIDEAYIIQKNIDKESVVGRALSMLVENLENILTRRKGGILKPQVGEELDPQKHKAVIAEQEVGYRGNTITEVFRYGYYLLDRIVREAEVKVKCGVSAKID